jgi:hypothetical protein
LFSWTGLDRPCSTGSTAPGDADFKSSLELFRLEDEAGFGMMCSVSLAPADQLWPKHSNFSHSAKTPKLQTPKPTIHPLLWTAFSRDPDPNSVFCRQHPSSAARRPHDINPFFEHQTFQSPSVQCRVGASVRHHATGRCQMSPASHAAKQLLLFSAQPTSQMIP